MSIKDMKKKLRRFIADGRGFEDIEVSSLIDEINDQERKLWELRKNEKGWR